MCVNIEKFRDGIFSLRTRRFGTVAEIMIKKIYNFIESGLLNYDLIDTSNQQRIEVKFSTVMKKCDNHIDANNVIEQCLAANIVNRSMKAEEVDIYQFDCNIQQIKPKEFDVLYYGLFFYDKIQIYRITSEEIKNNKSIGYSNHQHRDNEGEGQFHIKNDTFQTHQQYLIKELSYKELYKILK